MPQTITNLTGDGVVDDLYDVTLALPDAGTAVTIIGRIVPMGTTTNVTITGSPLAIPAAPASGSVFYNIQVDSVTGLATVQQSTVADPAAITGTAKIVFRQILTPTSTDPALVSSSTPDTA